MDIIKLSVHGMKADTASKKWIELISRSSPKNRLGLQKRGVWLCFLQGSGISKQPQVYVVVSNSFYVHPYLGKMNTIWLAHIFQMGWNQPQTRSDGWNLPLVSTNHFWEESWIAPAFPFATTCGSPWQKNIPSLKLTWMVGILSHFLLENPYFQGRKTVSFKGTGF